MRRDVQNSRGGGDEEDWRKEKEEKRLAVVWVVGSTHVSRIMTSRIMSTVQVYCRPIM